MIDRVICAPPKLIFDFAEREVSSDLGVMYSILSQLVVASYREDVSWLIDITKDMDIVRLGSRRISGGTSRRSVMITF